MAFPVVEARATSNEGSNVTTHTVSLPASPTNSNLLLGFLAIGVDADTEGFDTLPSGWTEITTVRDTVDGGQVLAVVYRVVDGSEGSTTTFTTTEACLSAHSVYEVSGAEDPGTQAPEASTSASSDSGNPDPDALTPTGGAKDYLWLALHDSQGSSTTAAPTDYTDLTTAHGGGTGGSAVELGVAERDLNASSEDPGTFTVDNTARDWVALTLAVHPAASGPTFPSAPTNVTATPVSETQIDLSWDAVTDANFYDIERDGAIIVKDHGSTSFSDTGLTANTEYSYRVRAVR